MDHYFSEKLGNKASVQNLSRSCILDWIRVFLWSGENAGVSAVAGHGFSSWSISVGPQIVMYKFKSSLSNVSLMNLGSEAVCCSRHDGPGWSHIPAPVAPPVGCWMRAEGSSGTRILSFQFPTNIMRCWFLLEPDTFYLQFFSFTIMAQDTLLSLSQLICMHGMITDPDVPGTEKLAVSKLRKEFGCCPKFQFASVDIDSSYGQLMQPHNVFFAKGWSRSVSAYAVWLCAYEQPAFFQAGLP